MPKGLSPSEHGAWAAFTATWCLKRHGFAEWATYRLSYNLRSDESIMLDACLKKPCNICIYSYVKLWCMIWICVNMCEYVCILTSTYKLYSINMNKQQQTKLKELWLDWTNTIHPTYHYKQHNQPLQNTHTHKKNKCEKGWMNAVNSTNRPPWLFHYPLLGSVTDPLKVSDCCDMLLGEYDNHSSPL